MNSPGIFNPLEIRSLKVSNRIVISPMCQYSAENGDVNDWHLAHYLQMALSGAGMIVIESTAVSKDGRISLGDLGIYSEQNEIKLSPTYIVVGNLPLVLRESLLVEVYDIGENFVTASKELVPPGMPGPFCMEGVYDSNGKFIAFEFSARIVAGTNIFTAGSPYSYLTHGANMSMGRRIALEIKNGIDNNTLDDLLT